jgi:dephospho-CoA kinase
VKSKIVGFAGRIKSGKSTISRRVAKDLGWTWVSFGDLLRDEASRRGLAPSSREVLQNLGRELIRGGWKTFCSALLKKAGWAPSQPLIVDSVRHIEAIDTLKLLTAPSEVKLVFVATDDKVRQFRLDAAGRHERIEALDADSLESQAREALPSAADLTVDGGLPEDQCARQIVSWLGS